MVYLHFRVLCWEEQQVLHMDIKVANNSHYHSSPFFETGKHSQTAAYETREFPPSGLIQGLSDESYRHHHRRPHHQHHHRCNMVLLHQYQGRYEVYGIRDQRPAKGWDQGSGITNGGIGISNVLRESGSGCRR